jgi:hypothetical protein
MRISLRFASKMDCSPLAPAQRAIYTAPTEDAAVARAVPAAAGARRVLRGQHGHQRHDVVSSVRTSVDEHGTVMVSREDRVQLRAGHYLQHANLYQLDCRRLIRGIIFDVLLERLRAMARAECDDNDALGGLPVQHPGAAEEAGVLANPRNEKLA